MRRITAWILLFVLLFSLVLLQGCASYKPLVKKDFASLAPLTVVYPKEGLNVIVKSTGGRVISTLSLSLIAGIGTNIYEHSLEKQMESAIQIDFEELIVRKFVDRVSKEIPNWPEMTIEGIPVNDLKSYRKYRNYVYNFREGNIMIFSCINEFTTGLVSSNLESKAKAIIRDSQGSLLWGKGFVYNSKKFGRKMEFKEYKADNFKLLKEEIEFAADTIVSDFIESLLK